MSRFQKQVGLRPEVTLGPRSPPLKMNERKPQKKGSAFKTTDTLLSFYSYVRNVLCEARKRGTDVLYFSAKDETYKSGVEASFGIMDGNYKLKAPITMQDLNQPC